MLIRWILSVVFLYVLSFLFSGIEISTFFAAVVAAAVLGLISVTVKPLLQIISLPITFLTLGLFYLVVNGLMLWLVSALVPGFSISGFWTAFFAAIVLSLLNSVFAGEK
ncbi:MAG: phage holin family protein [Defluviitaleaceae bacterium]|nr:phage holin family protein [Defluviitaleaceae bacterium]